MVNLLPNIYKGREMHTRWGDQKKRPPGRTRHRWEDK